MKVTVNFYGSESMEYDLKGTDISFSDEFVYIATSENEGIAFPKDDVENIEIEDETIDNIRDMIEEGE